MTNEIQLAPRQELTPGIIELIKAIAPMFHGSRLYGMASPEQAAVVMLKAYELGLPATAAFENFDMINGKLSMRPQLALALIHRSRNIDIKISDIKDGCEVWMRRRDTGFEYTARFTLADAQQAQIAKTNGGYDKYPADMFRARAIARCARVVAPDVLAGMYLTAELRTEWDEGDVIEVEVSDG